MASNTMTNVTHLLQAATQGNAQAAAKVMPLVYEELRRLAAQNMASEQPGQTLDPTALVHEAYLRLVVGDQGEPAAGQIWQGRDHFYAAAAEAMRRILIDNARRKKRLRHGGDWHRVDMVDLPAAADASDDLLDFDDALSSLALLDPDASAVIKLRFYAGRSVEEAAAALGLSRTQAYRHWTFGWAWLRCALGDKDLPAC
jgi:RNA polymerase sigma factor (TIGR02999 family)